MCNGNILYFGKQQRILHIYVLLCLTVIKWKLTFRIAYLIYCYTETLYISNNSNDNYEHSYVNGTIHGNTICTEASKENTPSEVELSPLQNPYYDDNIHESSN